MVSPEIYAERWELTIGEKLHANQFGEVYKVLYQGAPAALKLMHLKSDEYRSAPVLEYYAGIGAVQLLRQEPGALLLEWIEGGPCLKYMAAAGKDDQATFILVDVIRQLHAPRKVTLPDTLPDLTRHFRALFNNEVKFSRAAGIARELLAAPADHCLLHGDIHHTNVLSSHRGWLAIDPKGILGESTYDVANLLCNPAGLSAIVHDPLRLKRQAKITSERLHLDYKRVMAFTYVHACLSVCWSLEDGDDPSFAEENVRMLESIVTQSDW